MKLSIDRTEVAVQAAQFGSWNRNWSATNRFIDLAATSGAVGDGTCDGPAEGSGIGVGSVVGVGVGSCVGVDAGSSVGVESAVVAGDGVGFALTLAALDASAEGAGVGSAAAACLGMARNPSPIPRTPASAVRRRTVRL
jgi:hypothetical protein